MKVRSRGAQATIYQAHLEHNLKQFRSLHPGPITAVVKADAYGHGLTHVVPALIGADAFAVATIDEAMQLRTLAPDHRIILLEGVFNAEEMALALAHDFDVVVHQKYQLALLDDLTESNVLRVWLKVDTGMGRLGFDVEAAKTHIDDLKSNPAIQLHLMSHFAQSDAPLALQTQQQQQHNEWLKSLGLPYSFSNTGAVLNGLSDEGEWARIGIGLFGISPLPGELGSNHDLKPVMQLQSKIIATKTIQAGQGVGYGAHHVASQAQRIGVVGIGYADGYPWSDDCGSDDCVASAVVGAHVCQLLGRVSMDMLAIDLSELPDTDPGTDVVLWGEVMPVEVLAEALGVIPYALVCGITKRVKFHVIA